MIITERLCLAGKPGSLEWEASAEIERLRKDHAENARLLSLVAHDLQGRVEAGKLAAIIQCADRAREAGK